MSICSGPTISRPPRSDLLSLVLSRAQREQRSRRAFLATSSCPCVSTLAQLPIFGSDPSTSSTSYLDIRIRTLAPPDLILTTPSLALILRPRRIFSVLFRRRLLRVEVSTFVP
ncbi:hypothetical protein C8J57DRAFT_1493899 [Mycena rebaudengoi]|nr:hypothetical protein C8J57DRAFT_1493899 [Mycena rebaudengoi]